MEGLKLGNVSFDCDDVMKVATFWSAALGRPLDDWSDAQFGSIGTTGSRPCAASLVVRQRARGEGA
jgi:hypothetical protein